MLLRLNGSRSFKTPAGHRRDQISWAIDQWFFPETARHYPILLIHDSAVLIDWVSIDGHERRDRYSYAELAPHKQAIFSKADQYSRIDQKERTKLQQQVVTLGSNLADFTAFYEAMKWQMDLREDQHTAILFEQQNTISAFDVLHRSTTVRYAAQMVLQQQGSAQSPMAALLQQVMHWGHEARSVHWIPPATADAEKWFSFGELVNQAYSTGEAVPPHQIEAVKAMNNWLTTMPGDPAFADSLTALHGSVSGSAQARR